MKNKNINKEIILAFKQKHNLSTKQATVLYDIINKIKSKKDQDLDSYTPTNLKMAWDLLLLDLDEELQLFVGKNYKKWNHFKDSLRGGDAENGKQ